MPISGSASSWPASTTTNDSKEARRGRKPRVPLLVAFMAHPLPQALALNPALSFCETGGRRVFLDRDNNRYFCLADPLDAVFAAFVRGDACDDTALSRLASEKLVVPGVVGSGAAPCPRAMASASLAEGPRVPARRHYAGLLGSLVRVRWLLRRRPLAVLLTQLAQARSRARPNQKGQADLAGIVHAFEALSLLATTHDQCLPRSMALALYLAGRGHAPELVFGVRLHPFRAHCWAECNGWLVNGRLEEARHYTPILRV